MTTADHSNVLFKIAHLDLYERNPFNLLNLPVNATARDVRRRKEDIEAAYEAGTEADEFRFFLPTDTNRKPPSRESVDEAFTALEDPETRIAYALFWFWPTNSADKFENSNENIASWIETYGKRLASEDHYDKSVLTPIRRHNLAVMQHLNALTAEKLFLIDGNSNYSKDRKGGMYWANIRIYWTPAIKWWNNVTTDADFWHSLSELVSALNDPRLDHRFARSLRDQFAFAFDQINVELAIEFAKRGSAFDAKRQVEYMKLSQPEVDDVEGTFDDAFAGLQKQVEAIVNAARDEANKNPKAGLAKVDEILERTKDPVQISRIIFDKGEPMRESVIATIFAGVRNCMIAYGNSSIDWDGCLKRLDVLKSLAENDRQKALIAEDERIIAENKKAKDEEETCWFCKQKYSPSRPRQFQTIHLWGNMRMGAQFGQVSFSQRSIVVSMCKYCIRRQPSTHPSVKQLLDAGWHLGYEPSQTEIRKFLGIPEPTRSSPPLAQSGCLVPIAVGIGLLLLSILR